MGILPINILSYSNEDDLYGDEDDNNEDNAYNDRSKNLSFNQSYDVTH